MREGGLREALDKFRANLSHANGREKIEQSAEFILSTVEGLRINTKPPPMEPPNSKNSIQFSGKNKYSSSLKKRMPDKDVAA